MDFKELRELRIANNVTICEVSKKVGIAKCYLSLIETGKRKPSIRVAKKLAELYKMDWTKFFE